LTSSGSFCKAGKKRVRDERRQNMTQKPSQRRLLALVATGLVILALLSLTPSAWATPDQGTGAQQTVTIPPIKTSDKAVVSPGQKLVFEIVVANPSSASDTWMSAVVTDQVDSNLRIDNVTTTQGTASWVGQAVTANIGNVPPGTTVTIRIYLTVRDTAPLGYEVVNTAALSHSGYPPRDSAPVTVLIKAEFVPEVPSLLLLGSGLAGLAGYAGMAWRGRRK
jgi:uncharacterized repeat protein (TIGR01451 family)